MVLGLALVVLFVLGAVALFFVLVYNGLVSLKNDIRKSWSNIDVLLQQRYNELPNLLSCVKAYMAHETKTLQAVTEARTASLNAKSMGEKAVADAQTSRAVAGLFAVAENYPQLRAVEAFQQLQSRISGLENEIADRREFYNNAVNLYNIRIESIPDVFVANLLSYKREEFFKVTDEARKEFKATF